jgi:hypothetical protein
MPAPPTGTVTLLFTDIEGSTRLWESHPDEMATVLLDRGDLAGARHHERSIELRGGGLNVRTALGTATWRG